jgi:hypothetical protein
MSDQSSSPNLSQELVSVENTRTLCANLLRFLKESSVRGSEAYQLAQSIDFITYVYKQNDAAVKEIKKRLAKGEDMSPAPTPAPVADIEPKKEETAA